MSKKRKCRYTQEELAIHKEAVRLRNMTDSQLVAEFHRAADTETTPTATQRPLNEEKDDDVGKDTPDIKRLLNALSEGKCKGVKSATVYKITEFATEMGLI
ncbi:MAG: hypothetical protein LUG26_07565 [Ruminococcus sp.]|nr:hypothetical protein [Ruminococcus sp.]